MDGLLGTLCAVCESINWNIACHVIVEIVLLAVIIWLLFRNSYEITETHKLSAREIDELIMEWKAEPLTPPMDPDTPALRRPYVESKFGKYLRVDGEDYLNFGTMDFLGLASEPSIEDAAVEALHRFGTGTCGPRAFYGTLDIHMVLEERIAAFMRCEEAIVYSYGFATIASAIPAYCKRGDVIFVDRGVNFAIQKGLQASRSRIEFFNHNNMKHLRYLLEQQAEKDLLNPKKAKVTRRFIVVEGIYLYSGDICMLPELVKLKWQYRVRIFIDESVSFGVLGETGRGVTEHFGVDIGDIDIICCSLEYAAAGTGGFCCGRTFIVDHQRLSGAGYCYSASLSAPLTAALIRSLDIISEHPERIGRLQKNSAYMYDRLKRLKRFRVDGCSGSPLFHLRPEWNMNSYVLDVLIEKAQEHKIMLTKMSRLKDQEMFGFQNSIKLTISSEHTVEEMDRLLDVIEDFDRYLGEEFIDACGPPDSPCL